MCAVGALCGLPIRAQEVERGHITVPAFHGIREFGAQHDALLLQRCDPGLQLCRELRGMCLRGRSAVTVHAQLRSGIRGGSLDGSRDGILVLGVSCVLLSCVFQVLCLLSYVLQVPFEVLCLES